VGLWDDFTDVVDSVGDAVGDPAESAYDAVAGGVIGDVIATAATTVDTATFGMAGRALHAADDYVFDTVDYVTAGAVDVDFDDGRFTVGAGFDGLAKVGASVGEAGIGASGEALIGGAFDVRMTQEGFLATGSAGIDWGPLPYAEGHVELRANGDVIVNGHVQGTVPTPYGIVSGEASAGFTSTASGWGGYLDSQGTWRLPSGVTLGGGQHLAYQQTADGSHLAVGVNGSVSYPGMGTVDGAIGYERLEHDGDVVQGLHLEGGAQGFGMSARAEADYVHAEVDGVTTSDWSGDADFDGPSLESAASTAARLAGDELGVGDSLPELPELPDPVAAMAPEVAEPVGAFAAADAAEDSLGDLTEGLTADLP